MEKEIDKFTQKIDGFRGEIIPDWGWPGGSVDAFFDKFDKKPTIAELEDKEKGNNPNESKIEKSNNWERWL